MSDQAGQGQMVPLNTNLPRFTPEAIAAARSFVAAEQTWHGKALRIYLSGKGCSGFEYGVTFDDPAPDDVMTTQDQFQIVVDPQCLKFVEGSVVEWVDDERGKGFLVNNPNHRKYRGKFFKRPDWLKKFVGESTGQAAKDPQ